MIPRPKWLSVLCIVFSSAAAVSMWLFAEEEYRRIDAPDGRYTAVVTYQRYVSLLPVFPGQSGDKAGFIRIEDAFGANYGKIPVPMVLMANDLEWGEGGARLKLVGEWDFSSGEYQFFP